MSKKSFKDPTANIDRLFSNAETYSTDKEPKPHDTPKPQEPQKAYNTQNTYDTSKTHGTPKTYYRINLKLRPEYKEYLTDEAWKARKSITEYVNDLIQKDRDSKGTQDT